MSRLNPGDIVQHFKREYCKLGKASEGNLIYMYEILAFAEHTETKEPLVIYKALYTDINLGVKSGNVYARPYDMFMSHVDKEKYPDIKATFRFTKV